MIIKISFYPYREQFKLIIHNSGSDYSLRFFSGFLDKNIYNTIFEPYSGDISLNLD